MELAQKQSVPEEWRSVVNSELVSKKSRLSQFAPFLGSGNVLRLRGRTRRLSAAEFDVKHPILLDAKHPAIRLMLNDFHQQYLQMGAEYNRAKLNQKFFILGLRSALRSIQSQCVLCRKRRAQPVEPMMVELPKKRLGFRQRPFTFTGVDYFGPFSVTVRRSSEKRWGFLFTCITTRAIHLEVVHSLDTSSCLMAFERFIPRRGKPLVIWSDNGIKFVGTEKELKALQLFARKLKLPERVASLDIAWKFNPPAAPHHGGSWERLLRSVKCVLYAILGSRKLHDELLLTAFCLVEQTQNARPLVPVSSDPNDLDALTPNPFLLGRSSFSLPTLFCDSPLFNYRKQFVKAQAFPDAIWQRWLREYVPSSNFRPKWRTPARELKIGDLVWLVEDSSIRGNYPLARIQNLCYGADSVARSAELKLSNRELVRPVCKPVPVFEPAPQASASNVD